MTWIRYVVDDNNDDDVYLRGYRARYVRAKHPCQDSVT